MTEFELEIFYARSKARDEHAYRLRKDFALKSVEIGKRLGVGKQRVSQMVAKHRRKNGMGKHDPIVIKISGPHAKVGVMAQLLREALQKCGATPPSEDTDFWTLDGHDYRIVEE